LLWPLASPGLEKKFSIENFYAAYGYITNEEDEPGLNQGRSFPFDRSSLVYWESSHLCSISSIHPLTTNESDESFDFDMRDGEDSIRIQMTNYMVEVER